MEWPRHCHGFNKAAATQEFFDKHRDVLYVMEVSGCQVGCKDPWTGEILNKGWELIANVDAIGLHMYLQCSSRVADKVVQGRLTGTTAYYPKPMARRVARLLLKP
jgi:hypothetical protein